MSKNNLELNIIIKKVLKMLVKDLMSWPVITVFDNSTVGEALDILKHQNVRHLPVIDLNQTLVGVLSENDLIKVFPHGHELSTFQVNLLSRTPVSKVMSTNPVSILLTDPIEKAALILRTKKIGSLPVVDENQKMVGLLTKNDILDVLIEALGLEHGGTRLTIKFKKRWGYLSELVSFVDKHNIYIDNIVTFGQEIVIKLRDDSPEFIEDLRNSGFNITDISHLEPFLPEEN